MEILKYIGVTLLLFTLLILMIILALITRISLFFGNIIGAVFEIAISILCLIAILLLLIYIVEGVFKKDEDILP